MENLLAFLDESVSCYHAVEQLRQRLEKEGYCLLEEAQPWHLVPGGRYMVIRGGATLAAFRLPRKGLRGFQISAAHSDSPTFKVRQEPETAGAGCLRLRVEPYGGGIWRSWMDRPLSVAGRVMVRTKEGFVSRLVNVERDLLIIPSLAIHMDREVNRGTALQPQKDLLPLFAAGEERGAFRRMVSAAAGAAEEDVLATDLFLYPRMKAVRGGANGELIISPRLDDLQCVYACLEGFLSAQEGESAPIFCVFDHEEVGSGTRQGADSTFLTDVVGRICQALGLSREEQGIAAANSFLVSADNAHAVHPGYPEYADPTDAPALGGGVVIKYSANQRYTTDAVSDAYFRRICQEAGVPVQRYSNRADLPGGSTLGNISTAHFSVPTVDVGLPQLAMHSCCEVASMEDTRALIRAMTVFFSRGYHLGADGVRVL